MPLAAKLTDKGTQHDGYYETVITAGSSTVFIDGLPAARQGDPLTPHAKPKHPPHPRKIPPAQRYRPNRREKFPPRRRAPGTCFG
jgi:hypothetical protein